MTYLKATFLPDKKKKFILMLNVGILTDHAIDVS